ncbi:phosphoenolpyruvate--protein phosphotransferase [Terasakiella sp. A23]|uniref:phosphoenolpyruvate--protein phosphotransferase n=1 Tax=Terasakiella sp. FCG-A23 TaxID=3080561 RepID=UPI00295354B7|nr:phosphoenolpyruvate--protein phosphotransferase [Terasakiella sp. A23]MDV7341758.1 phosphoenolpyruvate--protein phosphotransferase [Terasakiella sp. A23]
MTVERTYLGRPVTTGIVIAPLHVLETDLENGTLVVPLDQAIALAKAEIAALVSDTDDIAGDILEFQQALLDDEEIQKMLADALSKGQAADVAWKTVLNCEIASYKMMDDKLLASRADDLIDLRDRVLRIAYGKSATDQTFKKQTLIFAKEMTPSQFISIDWSLGHGLVIGNGSPTSHVSILARAWGVPLMIGTTSFTETGSEGKAILDLEDGTLVVNPSREKLDLACEHLKAHQAKIQKYKDKELTKAKTKDGTEIDVLVNIDTPLTLGHLSAESCDGIGLTRTEFLFADALHDEESQYAFYAKLIEWAGDKPVTIRTLDAGGDKPIPGITLDEENPFLGVRGIRLLLLKQDIFRIQVRALIRAAALGDLRVLLPMVTVPSELDEVRKLFVEEVTKLQAKGVECTIPPIGIMVEIPATALTVAAFDADFFSIGSNDLTQYVTACSRDNINMVQLSERALDAVWQLVSLIVEAGKQKNIPVSICGDMASSPEFIEKLLKQGIRSFSCASAQIGAVKHAITKVKLGKGE